MAKEASSDGVSSCASDDDSSGRTRQVPAKVLLETNDIPIHSFTPGMSIAAINATTANEPPAQSSIEHPLSVSESIARVRDDIVLSLWVLVMLVSIK